MTWTQLLTNLLTLGKNRDELADIIRGMVDEKMISQEEATARIQLLDRLVNLKDQPVMVIHTESGSVYEVDRNHKRVRRLAGERNPTPRTGIDGEWKAYADIQPDPPEVGVPLLIVWEVPTAQMEATGLAEIRVPTTLTSTVVAINPPLS